MLGLGVIPSIVMCVCLLFLFETPRWLVFHGKVDKAREVMRKIRSDDVVEEELGDIVNDYELTSKNVLGEEYRPLSAICCQNNCKGVCWLQL